MRNKENERNSKSDYEDEKGIIYNENGKKNMKEILKMVYLMEREQGIEKKYEGDFKNGIPEGKGIIFDENGNKIYKGDYKNGKSDEK